MYDHPQIEISIVDEKVTLIDADRLAYERHVGYKRVRRVSIPGLNRILLASADVWKGGLQDGHPSRAEGFAGTLAN